MADPTVRLFSIAMCGLTAACSTMIGAARVDDVGAMWRGRSLADSRCASCHAVGARGQSANPKAPTFAVISTRYSEPGLGRELEGISAVGHDEMPALDITPHDRSAIVAYIVSLRPTGQLR